MEIYKNNEKINMTSLEIKILNLSEELRVLYVAMTRAKEKIIITGYVNNLENKFKEIEKEFLTVTEKINESNECLNNGLKIRKRGGKGYFDQF